jgi:hypothetical protein
MDYLIEGSGGINFGGLSKHDAIGFKFSICEVAYPQYVILEQGKLEQVYIKKRLINEGFWENGVFRKTCGPPIGSIIVYVDTYNRAWLEHELLTLEEAEALMS